MAAPRSLTSGSLNRTFEPDEGERGAPGRLRGRHSSLEFSDVQLPARPHAHRRLLDGAQPLVKKMVPMGAQRPRHPSLRPQRSGIHGQKFRHRFLLFRSGIRHAGQRFARLQRTRLRQRPLPIQQPAAISTTQKPPKIEVGRVARLDFANTTPPTVSKRQKKDNSERVGHPSIDHRRISSCGISSSRVT
jgi:hypothetical protein